MVINLVNLSAVALGGAMGAMGRFIIGLQVVKYFPHEIPFATLIVNTMGSFIIGALTALFLFFTPSDALRLFLVTGFLGALTTYSTFAIESLMLLNSNTLFGILNIVLNLVGTIACAAIGYKVVLYFLK